MQGITGVGNRAIDAARRTRRAPRGPEVHHRLIESTGFLRWQQFLCQGLERMLAPSRVDGHINAIVPRKHPIHVAVDGSSGQVKSYRANGGGSVIPHPFQGAQPLDGARKAALLHNLAGGSMHVAGSAVVTQSLPLAQHLVLAGRCQRLDCGETFHKAQPVVTPLLDACLLQDHFTHPDAIRVGDATPRQFAPMLRKPP